MLTDFRYALRMLFKSRGFTAVAVLSLALGIGANTAIFSFVDQLFIRPLPVAKPHELVVLGIHHGPGDTTYTFNYPLYADYRDQSDAFSGMVAYSEQPVSVSLNNQAERASAMIVTENYFSVFDVQAALGRTLLPHREHLPGSSPVVVISHQYWNRRFGGNPSVVGSTMHINKQVFTIVGVAPAEFTGTVAATLPDLYVPITMRHQLAKAASDEFAIDPLQARYWTWLQILGRLKPNITRAQAQASLSTLSASIAKIHPDSTPTQLILEDGQQGHNAHLTKVRLPMFMVQLTVVLLLLIACANVANLLLSRAHSRQREIAIRLSVGASRFRILRQLLTESVLLALLGAALGLLLASWMNDTLRSSFPDAGAQAVSGDLNGRVLVFTLLLAFATGIIFGLLPALQTSRPNLVENLKSGNSGHSAGANRWNLRRILAITQIAVSLLLLIAAGLCIRSARNLHSISPGFDLARVLVASVDLQAAGYHEPQGKQFFNNLLASIRALPGVEGASMARNVVLSGSSTSITIQRLDDYQSQDNQFLNFPYNVVMDDYFRTLGMPILRGRDFTDRDTEQTPRVVIVNEILAQRYWPGQDVLGKRIYVPRMVASPPGANAGSIRSEGQDAYEIIGVVKAGKYRNLNEDAMPMMYWSVAQHYTAGMAIHVRAAASPKDLLASVRGVVNTLDPHLPMFKMTTLEEQRIDSLFMQRMAAGSLTAFGLLGVLLAALGIYGVLSYSVNQRTNEIGIRMALGAQFRHVLGLIFREGMILLLIGVLIGLTGAIIATRFIGAFLHGVTPTDPLTFIGITLLLAAVGLLACSLPARRAARVDPMVALRYD